MRVACTEVPSPVQGNILDTNASDASPTFESRSIMTPHGTVRAPLFGTSILDSRSSEIRQARRPTRRWQACQVLVRMRPWPGGASGGAAAGPAAVLPSRSGRPALTCGCAELVQQS